MEHICTLYLLRSSVQLQSLSFFSSHTLLSPQLNHVLLSLEHFPATEHCQSNFFLPTSSPHAKNARTSERRLSEEYYFRILFITRQLMELNSDSSTLLQAIPTTLLQNVTQEHTVKCSLCSLPLQHYTLIRWSA
jgi:hypothetical protein